MFCTHTVYLLRKWEGTYLKQQVMHPLALTRCIIATATLQRWPDHRSTFTDQVRRAFTKDMISVFLSLLWTYQFLSVASLFFISSFLPLWNNKQGWGFLLFYFPSPPAPLPLYVTTFSLTLQVRPPAPLPISSSLLSLFLTLLYCLN